MTSGLVLHLTQATATLYLIVNGEQKELKTCSWGQHSPPPPPHFHPLVSRLTLIQQLPTHLTSEQIRNVDMIRGLPWQFTSKQFHHHLCRTLLFRSDRQYPESSLSVYPLKRYWLMWPPACWLISKGSNKVLFPFHETLKYHFFISWGRQHW